jgi:hypothetical protein
MDKRLLYIDLNGVLIENGALARNAYEFLEYCLVNYDCHWLTDWCKEGDATPVINELRHYATWHFIELAKKVKPTLWYGFKTEAIDFSKDFYWLDDAPIIYEQDVLKKHNMLSRWIRVDIKHNQDDLKRVMSELQNL